MNSFLEAYQAYFGDVYSYALRLCGQKALAEDLTSETFLKAMEKISSFRGQCQLRVWLCSITRNLYYSHLRKQGRVIPTDPLPEIGDSLDPAELAIEKDLEKRTLLAVNCLSEIPRRVLLLRVLDGLSFARIGNLFGKGENWACVTYHRAKRNVRERLEEEEYDPKT